MYNCRWNVFDTMGKAKEINTFGEYAGHFVRAINNNFQSPCTHVDIVFDCYKTYSINDAVRKRCAGKDWGIRCEMRNKDLKMPENWKSFIDINDNKVLLSKLLRDELLKDKRKPTEELVVSGGYNGEAATSMNGKMHHLFSSQEEYNVLLYSILYCNKFFV